MTTDGIPQHADLTPYPTTTPDVDWYWRTAKVPTPTRNPVWLRIAGVLGIVPAAVSAAFFIIDHLRHDDPTGRHLLLTGLAFGSTWLAGAVSVAAFLRWRTVRGEASSLVPADWLVGVDD